MIFRELIIIEIFSANLREEMKTGHRESGPVFYFEQVGELRCGTQPESSYQIAGRDLIA
jgi:hypothetical protein